MATLQVKSAILDGELVCLDSRGRSMFIDLKAPPPLFCSALRLEQVHGAPAYYLANQNEIDRYVAQADALAETQHQESRRSNAELIAKLRRMRRANQIPG